MKILIITGGSSSERKISLISAKVVGSALKRNGYKVDTYDFKKGFDKLKEIIHRYDVVFPVMHGEEGENGMLYKFLKSAKRPYVGSSPKGARIAFDKILFKKYCVKKRFITPRWKGIRNTKDIIGFGFPCVIKAASGGSSIEVVLLRTKTDLKSQKVKQIFTLPNLFVEELIDGVEITVGVLKSKVLPVLEIVPPNGGWFDYKNKYSGETQEIPFAPSVDRKIQQIAQKISLAIHKDLDLGSYSRTDFIVRDGIPFILEANTPGGVGFTANSLYPKAALAAGLSFDALVKRIVEDAVKSF